MTVSISSSNVPERLLFLDVLRGLAIIFMALNHTARWWVGVPMGWPRYHLVYVTLTLAAPLFLFLVGFCLPLSRLRSPALAPRKYLKRGLGLILAGFALNALVFPEDPFWAGGVLQTIGLGILVSLPGVWLLRYRAARYWILAGAVGQYALFTWAYPGLGRWVPEHPVAAKIWFWEFAPWPWVGLVLVGVVLGWVWTEQGDRSARARYLLTLAAVGALCILAWLAYDWWTASTRRMSFTRDFSLNRHWVPRGMTMAWILGMIFGMLAVAYYAVEVRRLRSPWLVTLGQTAFVLYFVHQLIALTLVNQWLGVQFSDWWRYVAANVLFVVVLVGLGWAWLEIKEIARRRGLTARRPIPQPPPG